MITISKYILNRKQKRAALVSCTLFAFMDSMLGTIPILSRNIVLYARLLLQNYSLIYML